MQVIQSVLNSAELEACLHRVHRFNALGVSLERNGASVVLGVPAIEVLNFFSKPRSVSVLERLRRSSLGAEGVIDRLLWLDLLVLSACLPSVRRGVLTKPRRLPPVTQPAPKVTALDTLTASRAVTFGCPVDFSLDPPQCAFSGPYLVRHLFQDLHAFNDQGDLASFADEGVYLFGARLFYNVWRIKLGARLPVMIGGDHSLTYFSARASATTQPIVFVQFDAHHDVGRAAAKEVDGHPHELSMRPLNHANFVYRLALRPEIARIVQIGVRDNQAIEPTSPAAATGKIFQFVVSSISNEASFHHISSCACELRHPVYISIDMDVIDPDFGLSVTTPLDDGISMDTFIKVLSLILRRAKLISGFDIVEFYYSENTPAREKTIDAIRRILQVIIQGNLIC